MGRLPTPLTTRGQAIPNPKALAEGSTISLAGRQVPKPRCLSPAAHSLEVRIAGRRVPKPRCLSPAAHSLDARIAGRQVPDLHGVSKQLYLARIAWKMESAHIFENDIALTIESDHIIENRIRPYPRKQNPVISFKTDTFENRIHDILEHRIRSYL